MPHDMDACSMNSFHRLRHRELKGKLPNRMWDYHLRALPIDEIVRNLVIADDILCVVFHNRVGNACLIPFGRGGEMSPLTDDYGKRIILSYEMDIGFVYYNSNNNSLIIVGYMPNLKIISVKIACIKAGQSNEYREIFAEELDMITWDFDIPNCRGMIYNKKEKEIKVFELKEYDQMFAIRVESEMCWDFQSRGNMYLGIYFDGNFPSVDNISLKTYSKLDGQVCNEAILHLHPGFELGFATLCGNDRMCVQQIGLRMQVIDISGEIPEIIETNIEAIGEPYYLDKLDQFLCYTAGRRLHVCNLRGDILNTFEDHRMRMPFLTAHDFYRSTYITNDQDIIISVCGSHEFNHCTINISSIITGKSLAKITTQDGSKIRDAVLAYRITSFAYDEKTGEIFTANENRICCVWSKKFCHDRQVPAIPSEDMRG